MLPFLYLQSFIYTLLVASGLGYLFENFFDSELLTAHSIIDIHKVIEHEKYSFPEISLPHVICGPLSKSNIISRRLTSIYNENIVNVAGVRHIDNEICYLLHSEPSKASQIQDEEWVIHPLPSVTKIHQSVLEYFQHEDILQDTTTDLNIKSTIKRRLHAGKVYADPKLSNDLLIGIQFVPGLLKPDEFPFKPDQILAAQSALEPILNRWSTAPDKDSAGDNDCVELMSLERSGGGTWHTVRETAVQRSGGKDACACALPSSTEIEYEGDFVRIVNLQDFAGTGAGCLARLVDIAAMDSTVLSVTLEDRPLLMNYASRGILQSSASGVEPFSAAGLTGKGEVVGVADSGLNDLSCFFLDTSNAYSSPHVTRSSIYNVIAEPNRRKVIQYVANADGKDDIQGHGTHVSGSVAGSSLDSAFQVSNGVASDTKIAFFDLQVSGSSSVTIPDLYQYVYGAPYAAGARVISNSWGSSSSGGYTSRSYASDLFVNVYKDALLVFAAGNTGAEYGEGSNFNPCISKNVLCVGSTNLRDDTDDLAPDTLEIAYFSSLGPTFDYRTKPEVVGPGFKIVSALSGSLHDEDETCGVTEIQGTSMSAPLLAGTAIIARQYFSSSLWTETCRSSYDFCLSFTPSGYLLKGLLIHSARKVTSYSNELFDDKTEIQSMNLGNPPDNYQGYGQVTLTSVLPLEGYGSYDLFVYDSFLVNSQTIYGFTVVITEAGHPLKVTLIWYDIPSSIGSYNSLLINNLDLCVIDTYGQKWLGNDANSSGTVDQKNPQEMVVIQSADVGVYTVYVSASTLVANQNQYAGVIITSNGYVSSGPVTTDSIPDSSASPSYTLSSPTPLPTVPYEFIYSVEVSFSKTLRPDVSTCIKSFEITNPEYVLSSVDVWINSETTSGTAAFLLGVLLTSPSGITVQVGGYYSWVTNDRVWSRSWPIHWTGQRAEQDYNWEASRSMDAMNLQETGRWYLCLQLMYSGWNNTEYSGDIAIIYRKNSTVPTMAPVAASDDADDNGSSGPQEENTKKSNSINFGAFSTSDKIIVAVSFAIAVLACVVIIRVSKLFGLGRNSYGVTLNDFSSSTFSDLRSSQESGGSAVHDSSSGQAPLVNPHTRGAQGIASAIIQGNMMTSMTPIHNNAELINNARARV